jgi:hypothetical protein
MILQVRTVRCPLAWVSCFVRDEEAAGSNPATPTTTPAGHRAMGDPRFASPVVRSGAAAMGA